MAPIYIVLRHVTLHHSIKMLKSGLNRAPIEACVLQIISQTKMSESVLNFEKKMDVKFWKSSVGQPFCPV